MPRERKYADNAARQAVYLARRAAAKPVAPLSLVPVFLVPNYGGYDRLLLARVTPLR
jgi:hypothetical protein